MPTFADAVVVAAIVQRKPSWIAWQPGSATFRKKIGNKPWS